MYHAIVCIKQVPDTTNIRIDPETGNLIRQGVPTILNPYDAHAAAAAIAWKRKLGGKVTVLSMGPPAAAEAIRECIEMGADRGILLTARSFAGADTLATSYVLAEAVRAIRQEEPVHAVFCGKQAIDGDTAQVGPGLAARLDLPLLTYIVDIRAIDPGKKILVVQRRTENRDEVIRAPLPAVLTCEKEIADLPFASLPDLIASLQFEPEQWSSEAPVRFDSGKTGLQGSPTVVWKTGTPAKHPSGTLLSTAERGVDDAVRESLEMLQASPCGDLLTGGSP